MPARSKWGSNMGVYSITCNTTQRILVGSSINLKSYLSSVKDSLNRGDFGISEMQDDWNDCGKGGFSFTVELECNPNGFVRSVDEVRSQLRKSGFFEYKRKESIYSDLETIRVPYQTAKYHRRAKKMISEGRVTIQQLNQALDFLLER